LIERVGVAAIIRGMIIERD